MSSQTIELQASERPFAGLSRRILNGEVFMLKNCLQEIGLFDLLEQASYTGISNCLGEDVANKVREVGVEKVHKVVPAVDIPDITDAVYEMMAPQSLDFLKRFISEVMGESNNFYFERKPNVRFHIPHDIAAEHMKDFKQFAKRRGDGKITPHNPHRDSWVDCPGNLINVWVAVGPIKTGNSLTIYPEAYRKDMKNDGPYLSAGENPGPANTFDMEAGDVLLFHGDQMHGSEINSTDCTRHVISFRITLEKPYYPHGHYHHYAYSKLAGGPLDLFAEVPQNLAWSFVDHRVKLIGKKLAALVGVGGKNGAGPVQQQSGQDDGAAAGGSLSIPLASLETGQIQVEIIAFSRYCPHQGADLSLGVVHDGEIMCPWHNLPIDPASGASPCHSLKKLKVYPCEVRDDQVYVAAGG
jgi:nitrite reductase/ring-hydroxylating ferredoxin subunit/ectoine hydroxylase-related dioxygenase (phytanoyl-CoA dioxygenase family)